MCKHFETKALQTGYIQEIAGHVTKAANMKTRSNNVKQEALFASLENVGMKEHFMHIGDCEECFRKLTAVFTANTKLSLYHNMVRNQIRRENTRDLVEA